jgi:hypothetical protein
VIDCPVFAVLGKCLLEFRMILTITEVHTEK